VLVMPASLPGYSIRGQWNVEVLQARVPEGEGGPP
jgi:hypothetical protein